MKKNTFLSIFLFILIITVVGLFYYYLNIKNNTLQETEKKTTDNTQTNQTKQGDRPFVTINPTTNKKIVEVPFVFVVKSITDQEIVLQKEGGGERDIAQYFPQKYPIKVFKGMPNKATEGVLADLKVGQKIKAINYVGEAAYFYIID